MKNDDSHIVELFIKTIYEEHNWSVVLEGPEEEFGNVLLEPKRQINANYLLIIPFISNLDEMEHYGFQQLLNLMHTQIWNPRGNYIIVSRSSLKSAEEFALYVLNKLWYDYKILNSFVLFTDLEEDMHDALKIETYTWIPQQTIKECLIPKYVVLAQRCEIKNANNYINSDSRIRNKIPSNFNKCPIIVATSVKDYFWETNENNETYLRFEDADIVVLDIILKQLNMTRLTQIALGHIAILARTRNFCESSVPYTIYRFKWFVPCGRNISRLSSMGRIFTFSFLLVLMVTILLTIVVMVFLASVGNYRKSESRNYTFFSNCSEYAWAVLLGVSVPKLPTSLKLRCFFISFVWFSYGVNMVFQIYFTSYLTEPGLQHVVEDYTELMHSEKSSVHALMSAITGVVDVAVGHIAILAQVQTFCESSVPYLYTHTYKWFVPYGRNISRLRSMGRIFTFSFDGYHIINNCSNGILSICWELPEDNCSEYAWTVLLGVSVPKLPKSLKLRYFFISFVWFSYGVNMVFQIYRVIRLGMDKIKTLVFILSIPKRISLYFTSYLTEPGLEHVVEDYTELMHSGLNILYSSNLYYYLNSSFDKRDTEIKRSVPNRDSNYCFSRVDKTESFAYLGIQMDARWYCHNHLNRRMCLLPDGAFVFMLAMHFPKGSYYIESFNRLLYSIIEAGLPEKK
ncbi:hypothetical protein C0J52_13526 [Blattella germanica]|nr:hypothetical protein C0J52_13526 [Blattella germanica]